jgi:uncharacterized membrane protein YuzA (DUF378 family)
VKGQERDGPTFDWAALVPRLVHPLKVEIIEALLWIDQPLSSADLMKVFGTKHASLSLVAYHVKGLAKVGAIKVIRKRQVRGAQEKFYFFLR